jgi:hypothetical protein
MEALILVHPTKKFDKGLLKKEFNQMIKHTEIPVYGIKDGDKPLYGKNYYTDTLEPAKDKSLEKHGRAPLKDEQAEKFLENIDNLFIGGGDFSRCIPSTYNSLFRNAVELDLNIRIVFLADLIYLQNKKKRGQPLTLYELIDLEGSEEIQFSELARQKNKLPDKALKRFLNPNKTGNIEALVTDVGEILS